MNRIWVTALLLLGNAVQYPALGEGVASCPMPSGPQVEKMEILNLFRDAPSDPAPSPSCSSIPASPSFKLSDELDRYLNAHFADVGAPIPKGLPRDRELVSKASMAFGVPEAVMTCLILKESNYDPNLVSSADAIGMSQITPDTLSTINKYIAGQVKGDQADELRKGWQAYWAAVYPGKRAPTHLTVADLRNPVTSIGAGTLWYRFGYNFLRDRNNIGTDDAGSWILAAGGYNIGVGGIARFCPKLEVDGCIAAMHRRGIKETENYMGRIRSCTAPGNFDRIDGRKLR